MKNSVSIIGIGALGQALARALHKQGYAIKSLYNRTSEKAERLGSQLEVGITGTFPASADELGEILFLSVSDGAITETADRLAALPGDFSGQIVAHCSGAETSALLAPLQNEGAKAASFHPLQTFNTGSDPQVFRDIYISLEGQEEAVDRLDQLATDLGGHPLHLTAQAKSYLHASAVMASNYLIALLQLAGDIAELGDIDHHDARKALQPLVMMTAQHSAAADLSDVLSGPVARGDVETIEKHLKLLEQNEQLTSLYKRLGLVTMELANNNGEFSDETVRRLRLLLTEK